MTDNLSPAKIRERADSPNTLVAFTNEEAQIVAAAIEIADEAAIEHLRGESHLREYGWLDHADCAKDYPLVERVGSEVMAAINKSIAYLESRGLLERHPEQPWVRIKELSA